MLQDACTSNAALKVMTLRLQEQLGQDEKLWQDEAMASQCLAKLLKDQEAVLDRFNSLAASVKSLTTQRKPKKR